jgi:UDP:flavonoid glycosyltransferase YjiC (YdhE family)
MGASMRVGIASYGATGHIYPLLSFADVLLAAGHDVIILTSSDLVPWLTGLAYAAEAVGESIGLGGGSGPVEVPGADHEPARRSRLADGRRAVR